MNARQLVTAYFVIAATAGVTAAAIIFRLESWPVSHFAMYSHLWGRHLTWIELYGIRGDEEIRLPATRYFAPLKSPGIMAAFATYRTSAERERALLHLLERYERTRAEHSGPDLQGLAAYVLQLELDPDLGEKVPPTKRTLLAKVLRPHLRSSR
jgi:hypothetical protein